MPRKRRDLDEDDVRVRPGRGKSRPRSKERPSHDDAVPAFVTAVDRGRFTLSTGDPARTVYAIKARELGRKGVVVGDRVRVIGDVGGDVDTMARIIALEPRVTTLRRTADDTDPVERVIVANADQLAIVLAVAEPAPQPRLVDRALAAAFDARMDPLLVLTKVDLAEPEPMLDLYAALDVPAVVTRRGGDLGALHEQLRGRTTVLIGSSGVGKSTLVNALVPGSRRSTGYVNEVTGRGRHTSTSAVALALADEGWIIDTPGLRSFGLAHLSVERVFDSFPDLAAGVEHCPRGCTHDEEECGLDAWVRGGNAGSAGPERLSSLRRLLRSRSGDETTTGHRDVTDYRPPQTASAPESPTR